MNWKKGTIWGMVCREGGCLFLGSAAAAAERKELIFQNAAINRTWWSAKCRGKGRGVRIWANLEIVCMKYLKHLWDIPTDSSNEYLNTQSWEISGNLEFWMLSFTWWIKWMWLPGECVDYVGSKERRKSRQCQKVSVFFSGTPHEGKSDCK